MTKGSKTSGSKTSHETEYDEIVRKLDALLNRHKRGNPVTGTGMSPASGKAAGPSPFGGNTEPSLVAKDDIPTLTEEIQVAPAMLSPQADIRSLLHQILDSALKDTGAHLDTPTRSALVQALESRLFSI